VGQCKAFQQNRGSYPEDEGGDGVLQQGHRGEKKMKKIEKNRKNWKNPKISVKNSKICSLSNCFGWSSVYFGSIETSKLAVSV
jgi:hypothetical protein